MALARNGMRALNRLSDAFTRPLFAALPRVPEVNPQLVPSGCSNFHTCPVAKAGFPSEPVKWPNYNDIVYAPRDPGEPIRTAEVFHYRANVKYSQKKLWYMALMIRGMTVDEALKQLSFMKRKGSMYIKETIEEAQEMAVRDHNVEFKSNLWIAESFVTKARVVKGIRKGARGRIGIIHFRYSHYYLCLREGRPPKEYKESIYLTGNEKMKEYIEQMRERRIRYGL